MNHRWFGDRQYFLIDNGGISGPQAIALDISLNQIHIHNGDTISRTLFGWGVESEIIDNTSGVDRNAWPCGVDLIFQPSPDGNPFGDVPDPGADALFREMLAPQRDAWTDGTLHGTKFTAYSGQYRNSQAQRKIYNKAADLLTMRIGFDFGFGPDDVSAYLPMTYRGYMDVAYLVSSFFNQD